MNGWTKSALVSLISLLLAASFAYTTMVHNWAKEDRLDLKADIVRRLDRIENMLLDQRRSERP